MIEWIRNEHRYTAGFLFSFLYLLDKLGVGNTNHLFDDELIAWAKRMKRG